MLIQIDNPVVVTLLIVVMIFSLLIWPAIKTRNLGTKRLGTPRVRVAALIIVLGFCFYLQSWIPALVFLWPLSFIWFPEFWGSFTGFIQGTYIDKPTPPIAIAACGWGLFVLIPVFYLWVSSR